MSVSLAKITDNQPPKPPSPPLPIRGAWLLKRNDPDSFADWLMIHLPKR